MHGRISHLQCSNSLLQLKEGCVYAHTYHEQPAPHSKYCYMFFTLQLENTVLLARILKNKGLESLINRAIAELESDLAVSPSLCSSFLSCVMKGADF